MAGHTKVNLRTDVEDMAPKFGHAPDLEARFATRDLELEKSGVSVQRLAPGVRMPFGHRQTEQEEVYVVVAGGGRAKLDDEIVELATWDALRVAPEVMRGVEAGDEGLEILVFGAPAGGGRSPADDAEMTPGWWTD